MIPNDNCELSLHTQKLSIAFLCIKNVALNYFFIYKYKSEADLKHQIYLIHFVLRNKTDIDPKPFVNSPK